MMPFMIRPSGGAANLAFALLLSAGSAVAAAPRLGGANRATPFEDVDPFIGTGGEGHTYPGATVPFGMVQVSPETDVRDFKESFPWAAGYRYSDTTILGFAHTHFSGTGHSDMGDVLLMPALGRESLHPVGHPRREGLRQGLSPSRGPREGRDAGLLDGGEAEPRLGQLAGQRSLLDERSPMSPSRSGAGHGSDRRQLLARARDAARRQVVLPPHLVVR